MPFDRVAAKVPAVAWMRANAAFVAVWVLGTAVVCGLGAVAADLTHAVRMAHELAGCANIGCLAVLPWALKRAGLR